jgi:hypothetical protein
MKNYHIILFGLCLLFSSCLAPITYFGDKFPPTTSIDVYYSAHDVKKDYKVIGHMTYPNAGQEYVTKELTSYAKKIGADAIIITGTENTKDNQAAVVNADALKYN